MKRFFLYLACFSLLFACDVTPGGSIRDIPAGTVLEASAVQGMPLDSCFLQTPIDSALASRIHGKSYKADCPIPLEDLRYLKVLHKNLEGETLVGEMICSIRIADDLTDIFRELYQGDYPIERMLLIDEYDADDDRSMEADNSSCFNYRTIANTNIISLHGRGMAVDINPKYNPYVTSSGIWPASSALYVEDRDTREDIPYLIRKGDLCYQAFISRGFQWGGDWVSKKDYQHFEKHE